MSIRCNRKEQDLETLESVIDAEVTRVEGLHAVRVELSSPWGYEDVLDNLEDGFTAEPTADDCVVHVFDAEQSSIRATRT